MTSLNGCRCSPWPCPTPTWPSTRTFLAPELAAAYLRELETTITWRQEPIRLFGRAVMQPRLTAWYGDPGARLRLLRPAPRAPALDAGPSWSCARRVEAAAAARFNCVLLNLYRHGQDSMGWHADDEPELGAAPVIASLSLGATRRFRLRPRDAQRPPHPPVTLELTSGSLLLMRGPTQQYWQHAVPKTARPTAPRLNLTFRWVEAMSSE